MSKSRLPVGVIALGALLSLALAAPAVGADGGCVPGQPGVIVHIVGLKQASGLIKVSLYGSDSRRWLAKKGRIARIKLPVTAREMDVCLAVPAPGRYAVAVHHDLNGNGDRDRQDGGGYSRNPRVGLLNPKPPFDKAAFTVGPGQARVGVTLLYLHGLSVRPAHS